MAQSHERPDSVASERKRAKKQHRVRLMNELVKIFELLSGVCRIKLSIRSLANAWHVRKPERTVT
jgi:hypothetical protein